MEMAERSLPLVTPSLITATVFQPRSSSVPFGCISAFH